VASNPVEKFAPAFETRHARAPCQNLSLRLLLFLLPPGDTAGRGSKVAMEVLSEGEPQEFPLRERALLSGAGRLLNRI